MDDPPFGRRLRVLIFGHKGNTSTAPLRTFLLQKGCPVKLTHNLEEFIDILKRPNIDFGMVIVLDPGQEKIFKALKPERFLLLEFAPGRCSLPALLKRVEAETKNFGRY